MPLCSTVTLEQDEHLVNTRGTRGGSVLRQWEGPGQQEAPAARRVLLAVVGLGPLLLEDESHYFEVELSRVRDEADLAQSLVLTCGFHHERAIAEKASQQGSFEAHVRDLAQRHHVDLSGDQARGQQQSCRSDDEIV